MKRKSKWLKRILLSTMALSVVAVSGLTVGTKVNAAKKLVKVEASNTRTESSKKYKTSYKVGKSYYDNAAKFTKKYGTISNPNSQYDTVIHGYKNGSNGQSPDNRSFDYGWIKYFNGPLWGVLASNSIDKTQPIKPTEFGPYAVLDPVWAQDTNYKKAWIYAFANLGQTPSFTHGGTINSYRYANDVYNKGMKALSGDLHPIGFDDVNGSWYQFSALSH